jgi:NSS family neurotransmitter:Na+ symporter
MGNAGLFVGSAFFMLLSIAALTSTISSTEVPVAYLVEDKSFGRKKATWLVSLIVLIASMTLITFFDSLFGLVIRVLTTIMQPLSCLFYFIVVGWLWKRGNKLRDVSLQKANKLLRWWANYLRYVCPVLLSVVFVNVAILN